MGLYEDDEAVVDPQASLISSTVVRSSPWAGRPTDRLTGRSVCLSLRPADRSIGRIDVYYIVQR